MKKHIHFIGIGGIGMSGIAQIFLKRGMDVSGSDLKCSSATELLKKQGAKVFLNHSALNIDGSDVVVYSSAIKDDNPELKEARKRKIKVVKRAEALAELMQDKKVIAVTGSHGKTTTTSLCSLLLMEAGLNPTVAIGGILRNIGNNVLCGEGDFFVAEADESDGSFLCYSPDYAVVTNIDREHLDYYKDFKSELNAFAKFLEKTSKDGKCICCADDENLLKLVRKSKKKHVLFGFNKAADIYAANIEMNGLSSAFDCFVRGKLLDRFSLSLGGMHNISNSLAVIALAQELAIDNEIIKKALREYKGAGRRIEIKSNQEDYIFIDDYAHHPTEIKATLQAVKGLGKKRLIAVFQPHRFTRTKLLMEEFSKVFDLADKIIVTDIYPASELPIEGITAQVLIERIKTNSPEKEAIFLPKEKIVDYTLNIISKGDLIITLGAGDISKISDELVDGFKRKLCLK